MLDILLVGQGIAGSCLGLHLHAQNRPFALIDDAHPQAASRVAAGLVNPITGRRLVKSWLADTLMPYARDFYQQHQTRLGCAAPFWEDREVVWLLREPKQVNDWAILQTDPAYAQYFAAPELEIPLAEYQQRFARVLDRVEIGQAGRVVLPRVLAAARESWVAAGIPVLEERFEAERLEIHPDFIRYKHLTTKYLILAEGFWATQTPLLPRAPFHPAKGEVLVVEIPDYPFRRKLVKLGDLTLAHLDGDRYWLGSGYLNQFSDLHPTESERLRMEASLREHLGQGFRVVEHLAGARPASRDRKPVLGAHPDYPNIFIFNGLGAKGSSLAPYFAEVLLQHILGGSPLPAEVDIRRFAAKIEAERRGV